LTKQPTETIIHRPVAAPHGGRRQIGTAAGIGSEQVAGFRLECMAGFVGIRIVNGARVRLARANLFQTLMSFNGVVDARIEFHFGLFADNKCRRQDGLDNKMLGL
jgi:hypothetical protein